MKIRYLLLFVMFLTGTMAKAGDLDTTKLHIFDGYTNTGYARALERDGWPVNKLNTARQAGYLTDEEKNLVLAMNLIRHDPPRYARLYVYPQLQHFEGNILHIPGKVPLRTQEGASAVRELYDELLETKPAPLFEPSEGLSRASADHAAYMKRTGSTDHEGQGGIPARASRHGRWVGSLAENLQWGTTNAHDAIMSLMVDDGIPSRGHRVNILNPEYTKVGVAIDEHPQWKLSYVIKYAADFIEKQE